MSSTTKPTRPDGCTDKHLKYLDNLRESGVTNMFGAGPWLKNAFKNMSEDKADAILGYWMETFGQETR